MKPMELNPFTPGRETSEYKVTMLAIVLSVVTVALEAWLKTPGVEKHATAVAVASMILGGIYTLQRAVLKAKVLDSDGDGIPDADDDTPYGEPESDK